MDEPILPLKDCFEAYYQISANKLRENSPPIRAYLHSANLAAFGNEPIFGAGQFLTDMLNKIYAIEKLNRYSYLIGIIWGATEPTKIINIKARERKKEYSLCLDLLAYTCEREWPGNPEVNMIFIRNRELVDKSNLCTDGLSLLGKEEDYRRGKPSLNDYFRPEVIWWAKTCGVKRFVNLDE